MNTLAEIEEKLKPIYEKIEEERSKVHAGIKRLRFAYISAVLIYVTAFTINQIDPEMMVNNLVMFPVFLLIVVPLIIRAYKRRVFSRYASSEIFRLLMNQIDKSYHLVGVKKETVRPLEDEWKLKHRTQKAMKKIGSLELGLSQANYYHTSDEGGQSHIGLHMMIRPDVDFDITFEVTFKWKSKGIEMASIEDFDSFYEISTPDAFAVESLIDEEFKKHIMKLSKAGGGRKVSVVGYKAFIWIYVEYFYGLKIKTNQLPEIQKVAELYLMLLSLVNLGDYFGQKIKN